MPFTRMAIPLSYIATGEGNVRGAARRERVRVDFAEQWARGAQRREPAGQLASRWVSLNLKGELYD